ncbi:MAG TPA: hypothetical protein DDX92_10140 [Flavobacteriales bacterium]|jgi:hypothetical protein|nr:hypothetical protein [Flavobacteriales bacterium]
MNSKVNKITYYVSTGLLSAMALMSAGMYFFDYPNVAEEIARLGYPTYIIYPLAVLKVLGITAIWTNFSSRLREWAYAGFFFNFVLAMGAHIAVNDGDQYGALAALILLALSYFFGNRVKR